MKNIGIYILFLLILNGCSSVNERSSNFSNLIDYQYLIQTNSEFTHPLETYKIRYKTDGFEITGYLTKHQDSIKRPTIIFARGGNRDLGTFTSKSLFYQQFLASKGYNVLSSQLRGNMFSEGKDEFGGRDLNDILQLLEINKSLEFTNNKVGVYGISRGGLNAYQISRLTDDIDAIAVVGAPTNPRLDFDTRPEMYDNVLRELVGDTIEFKNEYDYRSPLVWADEINEPVLILHGKDDWRVKPINAELMIEKMKLLNKEIEYEIIDNGDHGLNTHRELRNDKVVNWFNKHLK